MAVKHKNKSVPQIPSVPASQPLTNKNNWMISAGWGLLLIGGLAHMLPTQMEPLLKITSYGISLQMVVGVLSVLVALNFLLGDE